MVTYYRIHWLSKSSATYFTNNTSNSDGSVGVAVMQSDWNCTTKCFLSFWFFFVIIIAEIAHTSIILTLSKMTSSDNTERERERDHAICLALALYLQSWNWNLLHMECFFCFVFLINTGNGSWNDYLMPVSLWRFFFIICIWILFYHFQLHKVYCYFS